MPNQPTNPYGALRDRRILVADDGPDNQRLIEYHLHRAGARTLFVDHGQLAVDAIRQPDASFDAIVLDMQMPVMDGYTAAATLRDEGVRLPIIAFTANGMQGDRERALGAGCSAYLSKPIDNFQLVELLRQLIDQHAASLLQLDTV